MGKIDIVHIKKDHKKTGHIIMGILFVIIGIILIAPYIFDFIKIFLGILLILIGIYLLSKNKLIKNWIFFRF